MKTQKCFSVGTFSRRPGPTSDRKLRSITIGKLRIQCSNNNEAQRVVRLWRPNRHRTDDTVAACGAGRAAGSAGCPHRERPGAGHSGQEGGVFALGARSPGPVREGDSGRQLSGRADVPGNRKLRRSNVPDRLGVEYALIGGSRPEKDIQRNQ
jgi:hypothetical protein